MFIFPFNIENYYYFFKNISQKNKFLWCNWLQDGLGISLKMNIVCKKIQIAEKQKKDYKVQTNANEELMTLRENISYSIERSF